MIHKQKVAKPSGTHARNARALWGLLVPLATFALLKNIFVQLVDVVRKTKCGSSSTKVFGSHVVVFKMNFQKFTTVAKTIVDPSKSYLKAFNRTI